MLELLAYLRANGFKTFIVSGGGIEFMRPWTERVYGIPPEQVVGSSRGEIPDRRRRQAGSDEACQIEFVDDGPGKPVGINRFIGRRPIFAFGNSDGDLQMLQWTMAGEGPRFAGLVHHTDATVNTPTIGIPKSASSTRRSTRPTAKGWTVVDMKRDWKTVFPEGTK